MNQVDYKKKYNEALERMKSWARGEHPECFTEARKAAEFIFPELADSEDEKIRKGAIRSIQRYITYTEEEDCAPDIKDMLIKDAHEQISWLEKQKLSVSYDIIEQTFNKSKTYEFPENADAVTYSESILPTSVYKGENDDEYKMHKIIESAYIEGQKQNQKPVEWTEDDEKKMKGCISAILITEWESQELQTETINWLKSLKEIIKK